MWIPWRKAKKPPVPKVLILSEFIALLEEHKKLPAIWRNKDYDAPVTVVGYYGTTPDSLAHYVQVEGSLSGIPLSELLF